jgi:16S rRNA (guanine(527)-N(7))-methyltransferase RsmG
MSEPEAQDLSQQVRLLAGHHELPYGAADALVTLARKVVDPDEEPLARKSQTSIRNRFASSLIALELDQVRTARRMADIGCGSGFPGLVLAAALPRTNVTLVEKKAERCSFLQLAVDEMGLSNVEVVHSDAEQWPEGVASCDLVTSRAVARPDAMIELVAPLLALGGTAVLWGTAKLNPAKQAEAAIVAEEVGLQPVALRLTEPFGTKPRHLHVYVRVTEMPIGRARERRESLSREHKRQRRDDRAAALDASRDRAATHLGNLRARIQTLEAGGVDSDQAEELKQLHGAADQLERKIRVLTRRRSRAASKLNRQVRLSQREHDDLAGGPEGPEAERAHPRSVP